MVSHQTQTDRNWHWVLVHCHSRGLQRRSRKIPQHLRCLCRRQGSRWDTSLPTSRFGLRHTGEQCFLFRMGIQEHTHTHFHSKTIALLVPPDLHSNLDLFKPLSPLWQANSALTLASSFGMAHYKGVVWHSEMAFECLEEEMCLFVKTGRWQIKENGTQRVLTNIKLHKSFCGVVCRL